jgi:hypothetical protein
MGAAPEIQERHIQAEQGEVDRLRQPDYGESLSPVVRLASLRTLLAPAAIRDLDVRCHLSLPPRHSQGVDLHGAARWARSTRPGGLGPATQEGSIRVGAGWEDVERGAQHLHGE